MAEFAGSNDGPTVVSNTSLRVDSDARWLDTHAAIAALIAPRRLTRAIHYGMPIVRNGDGGHHAMSEIRAGAETAGKLVQMMFLSGMAGLRITFHCEIQ